jgi:hypothetical protein
MGGWARQPDVTLKAGDKPFQHLQRYALQVANPPRPAVAPAMGR